jgi:hypothetical protein
LQRGIIIFYRTAFSKVRGLFYDLWVLLNGIKDFSDPAIIAS